MVASFDLAAFLPWEAFWAVVALWFALPLAGAPYAAFGPPVGMGWQKHTVRGFMAGAMKKAGHAVESFRTGVWLTAYLIPDGAAHHPPRSLHVRQHRLLRSPAQTHHPIAAAATYAWCRLDFPSRTGRSALGTGPVWGVCAKYITRGLASLKAGHAGTPRR